MTPAGAACGSLLSLNSTLLTEVGGSVLNYVMVMLGAAAGGLARYVLSAAITPRFGGNFPMGTFIVNVSGSFVIGLLMTLLTERWVVHPWWRLLLVVGMLGGYTTFSSLEYETLQAMRRGLPAIGLLYACGSLVLGYLAAWLGMVIAARR